MWWDWAQITILDSVLFSIVSMLILFLVGWGITRLLSVLTKTQDFLSSSDFIQRVCFRIFFGMCFVIIFILFFSIFNLPFLVSSLLVVVIAISGFLISPKKFKFKIPNFSLKRYAVIIVCLIVVFSVLMFLSFAISGFYGSNIDDAADHTLMVKVILDNPSALITRSGQPYFNALLNYPTGSHVLSGFLLTLLSVPIQKIIILVSVIVPVLIALSFYSTIKYMFESKFLAIVGLIFAAFFAVGTLWVPISWGGLPFLLSLYLSISSVGLIFAFLKKQKITLLTGFLLGLIFSIAIRVYPIALLMITLWSISLLIIIYAPRLRAAHLLDVPFSNKRILSILLAFLLPIILSLPYLYFIYVNNVVGNSFSSLGSVATVSSHVVQLRLNFNWLFDIPKLSVFFSDFGSLFVIVPLSLLIAILLIIPKVSEKVSLYFPKNFSTNLLMVYLLMLLMLAYLTLTTGVPINFLLSFFNSEKFWAHLIIPAVILSAVVIYFGVYLSYLGLKRLFTSNQISILSKNRIFSCILVAILIFNVGVLCIPIVKEQQRSYTYIGSSFQTYQILNQTDLSLMNWITQNIPSDALILVSAGDSGQYVAAVTHRHTFSRYNYIANYFDLMAILTSNASDPKAIPLLQQNNISYVYIGSIATTYAVQISYYRHFNATQFLSSPYFTLAKEVGDAWLFQFNATTTA